MSHQKTHPDVPRWPSHSRPRRRPGGARRDHAARDERHPRDRPRLRRSQARQRRATVTFAVEEQDKDRAAATARVNQKMKQGTDIVRREDPQAELKTSVTTPIPVYPEVPDGPRPLATGRAPHADRLARGPVVWK